MGLAAVVRERRRAPPLIDGNLPSWLLDDMATVVRERRRAPPLTDGVCIILDTVVQPQRISQRKKSTPTATAGLRTECESDGGDGKMCSICQDDVVARERVATLRCGHKYHFSCIETWLRHKNACPLCRATAV